MGREIKFRCWFKNEMAEQMLYDERPGDCLVWKNQGQDIEAIMQFTGLHDKNGKEIFEGDIVKVANPETNKTFVYKVGFNQGCFTFNGWLAREVFNMVTVSEVMGNIHENPELLEQTS